MIIYYIIIVVRCRISQYTKELGNGRFSGYTAAEGYGTAVLLQRTSAAKVVSNHMISYVIYIYYTILWYLHTHMLIPMHLC